MSENAKKLLELLKKSSIDSNAISEEELEKIAQALEEMYGSVDGVNQRQIEQALDRVNNSSKNPIPKHIESPINTPPKNDDKTAKRPSNLDKNKQGTPANNGLNYTDHDKSMNFGNKPEPTNGKGRQKPTSSKVPAGADSSSSSPLTGATAENDKDLNSEHNQANTSDGVKTDSKIGSSAQGKDGKGASGFGLGANPFNRWRNNRGSSANPISKEGSEPKVSPANSMPRITKVGGKVGDFNNPHFDSNGNMREPLILKNTPKDQPPKGPSNAGASQENSSPKPNNESDQHNSENKNEANKKTGSSNGQKPSNTDNKGNNKRKIDPREKAQNILDKAKAGMKKRKIADIFKNGRPSSAPLPYSGYSSNSTEDSSDESNPASNGNNSPRANPSPLSRLRNLLKNRLKRDREVEDTYNDPKDLAGGIKDQAKKQLKNKIRLWIAAHLPAIGLAVGAALFIFLIIIIICAIIVALPDMFGLDGLSANVSEVVNGNQTACTYGASANLGQTEIKNAKVELINCDGKPSNYKTLGTVDFEKYVLGVALAEIGPDAPDEALKAQIVAARTYTLTRNKGMCPGDADNCFYGYNKKTNTFRMRACENDQVYWDYDQDIYRYGRGSVSLYSPEVNSGIIWKRSLNADKKAKVEALAAEVIGKALLDDNGNTMQISYNNKDQNEMKEEAKQGLTYDQILHNKYAKNSSTSGVCQTGNMNYDNYQLESSNSGILHLPLSSFLASKGSSIEEFNQLIDSNVKKAGYGTRAAVVSAAVTLIGELGNKYNVKVPYYWGGGHGAPDNLANGNWGSTACHTYANGQSYNFCGLDCSGFVGWAIYNGGYKNVTRTAESYVNISGARGVDLSSSPVLQPGDLLYNSHHVILIIAVDNKTGQYTCAEAKGNQYGVLFTKHSFDGDGGKYRGVDMSGFYENSSNIRG